jgi:hypothetical protein
MTNISPLTDKYNVLTEEERQQLGPREKDRWIFLGNEVLHFPRGCAIHTEGCLRLRAAGYSPIPVKGKQPQIVGWPEKFDADNAEIVRWEKEHANHLNTGLITRTTPTLDIDILNEKAATAVEALVRERYATHGRVMVRIGKPPKRAIPFRTNVPFSKLTVKLIAPDGSSGQRLEFLGDGQQFVCFGIHPDTGQSYAWHGGAPIDVKRSELPEITEAEAKALLDDVAKLLCEHGYRLEDEPKPQDDKPQSSGDGTKPWSEAEEARLRSTLDAIPTDEETLNAKFKDSHLAWIKIGLAIERLGWGERGYAIWRDWSARNKEKFNEKGLQTQWKSFERRRDDETNPVTVGTIYYYAKQFGWKPKVEPEVEPLPSFLARFESSGAQQEEESEEEDEPKAAPAQNSLEQVHTIFRKWLDQDYDLDALDVVLTAAAAEQLTGDPLWLLLISGPGGAKTETVQALSGAGAHVTSTIASEGALLSAVPAKNKAQRKTATGGLLRRIGDRGILVIKDVTSLLSADRNVRGAVLAALREVYDGKWERNVGTEGGQTLTWKGRIVVIGAVTTAWDAHHAVVAALGDRFVLIRMDSSMGRSKAGKKSIRNTGDEVQMRQELRAAVGGLLAHTSTDELELSDAEVDKLAAMADIVTMARTAVERDYKGDVTDVHAPEMPTRFAKQLAQVIRGGVAIGMARKRAMQLAVRCARDSIPPRRLEILLDLARNPNSKVAGVRRRINKPYRTTAREMDALQMLGMLEFEEEMEEADGKKKTVWLYSITPTFDIKTLREMAAIDSAELWRVQGMGRR